MRASSRRRRSPAINVWPGFVDALSSLLLVIIFVLLAFVLTQFYLGRVLSGRDQMIAHLSGQLNEMTEMLDIERQTNAELKVNIGHLTEQLEAVNADRDRLQAAASETSADRQKYALMQHDIDALRALKDQLEKQVSDLGAKAGSTQEQLNQEHKLSADARAQSALLTQQLEAMRQELARISAALGASENLSAEQKAQIVALGKRLNAALASKVEELARYRSEFFGRVRQLLGDKQGIRVEGDRFVFQSELLFATGSDELGADGQARLAQLAKTLAQLTQEIPPDINWILRVDGHTDKTPFKGTGPNASNWELSTHRALSVVKFLASQGIPEDRLAAAGFGAFQPVDKGDSAAALARNRRIEIRLDQR